MQCSDLLLQRSVCDVERRTRCKHGLSFPCAELIAALLSHRFSCQRANRKLRWLYRGLAACLPHFQHVRHTSEFIGWRWRGCSLNRVLEEARNTYVVHSVYDDLDVNQSLSIKERLQRSLLNSLAQHGCCDIEAVSMIQRFGLHQSNSVRARGIASLMYDCAHSLPGKRLEAWKVLASAQYLQVRQTVFDWSNCSWKAVRLSERAELREFDTPMPNISYAPNIVGGYLPGFIQGYHDRAAKLYVIQDVDILFSNLTYHLFIIDELQCEVYLQDHFPDEPHAVGFRSGSPLAPVQKHWDRNDKREGIGILWLADFAANHYHFLTEFVSKLVWLKRVGWPKESISGEDVPLLYTFGHFGIGVQAESMLTQLRKILRVNICMLGGSTSSRYKMKTLYLPAWEDAKAADRSCETTTYLPPAKQTLQLRSFLINYAQALDPFSIASSERILLITREDAGSRSVNGLAQLMTETFFDVRTYKPESIDNQVRTFAQHRTVVSPSGAALANMLFSPADAALVFLPLLPWNDNFHHLAAILRSIGCLSRGLHIVASMFATIHSNYTITVGGCMDLLLLLDDLVKPTHRVVGNVSACESFPGEHALPQTCGSGPAACIIGRNLEWLPE